MRARARPPRIVGIILATLLAVSAPPLSRAASSGLLDLSPRELAARQRLDTTSLANYRNGLARTVAFARTHPELFPTTRPAGARLLAAAERDKVRAAWKSMLDYTLALEALEVFHGDFALLTDSGARSRSFQVASGAFLAAYRFALDFIDLAERDPKIGVILNDQIDDLGLPRGAYDRYKFKFLNVAAATRFTAYTLAGQAFRHQEEAVAVAKEDAERILAAGRGRGEVLTAGNAVNVLRQLGARAVFPVQSGISEWMGDTKVVRHGRSLISSEQIAGLRDRMLPGDIMLQRREWYLSNVGLPGFWSHAALYVGTPDERRAFFSDEEVRRWVTSHGEATGELERLLERTFPSARAGSLLPPEHGHAQRVIEAMSEGVVFTTMEHSAAADSVVVLRPRLPRTALAAALVRAWAYAGRPYDFDFDFQTDSALVCTELIYKAFEPSAETPGLRLDLEEILGRTAIPANAIARQFDKQYGTPVAQFDFVAFLDGQEKAGGAVEAGVEEFRKSWQRPKWHVLVQEQPGGNAFGRDEIAVALHHAFGTRRQFTIEGRVFEREDGPEARPGDSRTTNFLRTVRSLHADEQKGVPLRLRFADHTWELHSDSEGYFALQGETPPRTAPGWHPVQIEVSGNPAHTAAKVLIVPDGETIGVISDIDDTVVVSEVGNRTRLLAHTFLENPLQRRAVPGVAALYRRIAARNAHPESAPVIYLTAAPRHLLPAIGEFLAHNNFPVGPIIAKKVTDGDGGDPLLDQERYKLERIATILDELPDVRFVLSGDDGERDPEVFRKIREKHPGRVEAVYIRRVSGDPSRPTYEDQLTPP